MTASFLSALTKNPFFELLELERNGTQWNVKERLRN